MNHDYLINKGFEVEDSPEGLEAAVLYRHTSGKTCVLRNQSKREINLEDFQKLLRCTLITNMMRFAVLIYGLLGVVFYFGWNVNDNLSIFERAARSLHAALLKSDIGLGDYLEFPSLFWSGFSTFQGIIGNSANYFIGKMIREAYGMHGLNQPEANRLDINLICTINTAYTLFSMMLEIAMKDELAFKKGITCPLLVRQQKNIVNQFSNDPPRYRDSIMTHNAKNALDMDLRVSKIELNEFNQPSTDQAGDGMSHDDTDESGGRDTSSLGGMNGEESSDMSEDPMEDVNTPEITPAPNGFGMGNTSFVIFGGKKFTLENSI